MSQNVEKSLNESQDKASTNLGIGVYSVYDCILKQFRSPVCLPKTHVSDYFTLLVNDVQSPFYGHESDYILNKIGDFDINSGEIKTHFIERVAILDVYINKSKRDLQTIIQTLNYLPTGYFKMPAEQKDAIQSLINSSVEKYVKDYVVPDMDINAEKIKDLESIIQDYEDRLNIVKDKDK